MGMGKTMQSLTFLLCLMNAGAVKNALIVCPNALVDTTWREEAEGLINNYFGTKCNIQVNVVTCNMPEKLQNKILKKTKNW